MKVLCVGLVCLDLINECKTFPEEDSDQRCLHLRWQRGGNASNNCSVLSKIGIECEFLGLMSSDLELSFLSKDFLDHGICIEHCPMRKSPPGKSFLDSFPVSTVIVNSTNGSRTILHSKGDFPELTLEHFKKIDISKYSWIHFEGRNVEAVSSMMQKIKSRRSGIEAEGRGISAFPAPIVSVELEKPKLGLLALAIFADVVFIGKDFAMSHGWEDKASAIKGMTKHVFKGSVVVCAWGDQGSSAMYINPEISENDSGSPRKEFLNTDEKKSKLCNSPAYPPPSITDTLGAGDTFVSGFIWAFLTGFTLEKSLQFACQLAGAKVGMVGFSNIKKSFLEISKEHH